MLVQYLFGKLAMRPKTTDQGELINILRSDCYYDDLKLKDMDFKNTVFGDKHGSINQCLSDFFDIKRIQTYGEDISLSSNVKAEAINLFFKANLPKKMQAENLGLNFWNKFQGVFNINNIKKSKELESSLNLFSLILKNTFNRPNTVFDYYYYEIDSLIDNYSSGSIISIVNQLHMELEGFKSDINKDIGNIIENLESLKEKAESPFNSTGNRRLYNIINLFIEYLIIYENLSENYCKRYIPYHINAMTLSLIDLALDSDEDEMLSKFKTTLGESNIRFFFGLEFHKHFSIRCLPFITRETFSHFLKPHIEYIYESKLDKDYFYSHITCFFENDSPNKEEIKVAKQSLDIFLNKILDHHNPNKGSSLSQYFQKITHIFFRESSSFSINKNEYNEFVALQNFLIQNKLWGVIEHESDE